MIQYLLLLISSQSCFCPIYLPTSVLLTQKYIVDIGSLLCMCACMNAYMCMCVCFESSYVYYPSCLPHLQWGTTDTEINVAAAKNPEAV